MFARGTGMAVPGCERLELISSLSHTPGRRLEFRVCRGTEVAVPGYLVSVTLWRRVKSRVCARYWGASAEL